MLKRIKKATYKFINDNDQSFMIVLIVVVSLASYVFVYSNGLVLAIEDGRAHLNISRRLVDSLTPGFAQLGGIWLPLPHLLTLPFIWNEHLWHSGMAGSLISTTSFVIASFLLYKFLTQFFDSKKTGFIGALVFITNPNLLFIQSTPMTELLFLVLFMAAIHSFWKWISLENDIYLITTGVVIFLATLTRYDGWILPVVFGLGIVAFGLLREWKYIKIEGKLLSFLLPACFGIFLWLIYNFAIFGHPLHFALGEGSASSFANHDLANNELPTKYNLLVSAQVLGWNIVDSSGVVVAILGIVGLFVLLLKSNSKKLLFIFLILSPILFNLISLFFGQSVMWSDKIFPYRVYNSRYALLALPALSLFVATLVAKRKIITIPLVTILIVLQLVIFNNSGPIILMNDITQTQGSIRERVGRWISNNPTDGLTLITAGANEALIFESGKPIKTYVYEGNKHLWKQALQDPYPVVSRIVLSSVLTGPHADKTYTVLKESGVLEKKYKLIYSEENYQIYDRINIQELQLENWKYRSVDTMKTSRDKASQGSTEVDYKKELEEIKKLGSNYVAIGTPYDEEYYPYLKLWADEAHRIGLNVWFRGNWSGWEGWSDYPKQMTRKQHLQKTEKFILEHPELFIDGDSFTPCPECEYGGPGNPLETQDFEGFRKFMIDEYRLVKKSFFQIEKDVHTNWFSMNPDVARKALDQATVSSIDNLITLDIFVKDIDQLVNELDFFVNKFPNAKLFIGEFGAPIPEINGSMTEEDQAVFVNRAFQHLHQRVEVVGVNYWVSSFGSTALFDNNLESKDVAQVVKRFYEK